MARVAADPGLRETLIARGYANVRRFSWTACARSVLDAIEACASG
jgi:glycosyltransferase involved in cell wall biosynthesis